jgi:hypothetical protein
MNRDDIIRMAREAGGDDWGIFRDFMPEIERFANLVAAAEREACAKVCENIYEGDEGCGDWPTPEMCAFAIRERGAPALERLNKAAEDNGEEL